MEQIWKYPSVVVQVDQILVTPEEERQKYASGLSIGSIKPGGRNGASPGSPLKQEQGSTFSWDNITNKSSDAAAASENDGPKLNIVSGVVGSSGIGLISGDDTALRDSINSNSPIKRHGAPPVSHTIGTTTSSSGGATRPSSARPSSASGGSSPEKPPHWLPLRAPPAPAPPIAARPTSARMARPAPTPAEHRARAERHTEDHGGARTEAGAGPTTINSPSSPAAPRAQSAKVRGREGAGREFMWGQDGTGGMNMMQLGAPAVSVRAKNNKFFGGGSGASANSTDLLALRTLLSHLTGELHKRMDVGGVDF